MKNVKFEEDIYFVRDEFDKLLSVEGLKNIFKGFRY